MKRMKFREAAETMSKGGGRALGAAISETHSFKEIGFKTFESLFVLVLDYCSRVWGFNNFSCVNNVQIRALLYFVGLYRFNPPIHRTAMAKYVPVV